jgi:hypothetical protein
VTHNALLFDVGKCHPRLEENMRRREFIALLGSAALAQAIAVLFIPA